MEVLTVARLRRHWTCSLVCSLFINNAIIVIFDNLKLADDMIFGFVDRWIDREVFFIMIIVEFMVKFWGKLRFLVMTFLVSIDLKFYQNSQIKVFSALFPNFYDHTNKTKTNSSMLRLSHQHSYRKTQFSTNNKEPIRYTNWDTTNLYIKKRGNVTALFSTFWWLMICGNAKY